MGALAIDATNVTKLFAGGITAVDQLDLRIKAGSVYGLIGPNGAGKTTALRLLMGLLRPDSGSARILGYDLWNAPRAVRARVAYISQAPQLPTWMTLEELCRYASHLYERWDGDYSRHFAQRWEVPARQPIGRLSTGDQRKAALLLAFASRADVLLLDEPAAGLDPITRRALVDEIIDMVARGDGCTVLFSTHLLEDLERVVDGVGIMDQGRLIISSRLDDLLNTIKRVQVVFQGEQAPAGFEIPGAVWTESSGPVVTALARLINDAQLDPIRHYANARLQVFPLGLEEILLAFFRGRPGERRTYSAASRFNTDQF